MVPTVSGQRDHWHWLAVSAYVLLLVNVALWETWGAPAQQASVYTGLLLKTVPLMLLLPGVWKKQSGAHLLASLLMLLYFTEGVVLVYSEWGQAWHWHNELVYATIETVLSIGYIGFAGLYIRTRSRHVSG
jgi:uncharacterized membrane protein